MHIIDISVPIHAGMVVYEGDPPIELQQAAFIAKGDLANVSRINFGVHTGTHIDAPKHFLDGAPGVDSIALDTLVGPCLVVDATHVREPLDAASIQALRIPAGTERLLLKTTNSDLWAQNAFSSGYIGLTLDGAQAVVNAGIRLIGIDYLSVSMPDDPAPPHIALLAAGVVIVEGLDLRGVQPGRYTLACLPLRLIDTDGAPARAILMRD